MRRTVGISTLILGVLLAGGAIAAPDQSLRPVARSVPTETPTDATETASVPVDAVRPQQRPEAAAAPEAADDIAPQIAFLSPDTSPFPYARPAELEEKVLFGRRKKKKGSVCGDIDIQGTKVGDVPGKIKGCGVQDAVKVTSVSDVRLSQGAVMSCETAKALNTWVSKSVKPTFRQRGPVVELRVAAHYICRTRNNQPGGRISEHGKGKAIDISAFTMMDGEVITVAEGWKRGSPRKLLKKVWKGACGPFGTVLGPDSDVHHRDHFHMDTAGYRSGPYCR